MALFARIVRFCSSHSVAVIIAYATLCLAAAYYVATHFAMNTDSESLISSRLPWRQTEIAYDAAFPQQNNLIVAVIDGVTAERAEEAASSLDAALRAQPQFFESIRRPDGGPFFSRNGLLFLPLPDVQRATQQLIQAQPLLGSLAADPSLRGIMTSLSTALMGVEAGQTTLAEIGQSFGPLSTVLASVLAGRPAFLGWRTLVTGEAASKRETRRFIEIRPRLNYAALQPGAEATSDISLAVQRLSLTPLNGVTVRLTGQIPMADEEFATLSENMGLMGTATGLGMVLMLWLALNSIRLIVAVIVAVVAGLCATAAFGLLAVGSFNIISVAFIVLYVGLGIDFAIQFSVRFRAERFGGRDVHAALVHAGGIMGPALGLAALSISAGFLAFVPTDYAGVAELGIIAGTGMIVSFIFSLTFLPALLRLFNLRGEPEAIGLRALKPLDEVTTRKSKQIAILGLVLAGAGLLLVPLLRFDANPLNLRSTKTESVATALDLMQEPDTSPNTINVIVKSRQAAADMAARLSQLPQVERTLTIDSFIPDRQSEKLAAIADAAMLLEPTLDPVFPAEAPSDAEIVASLKDAAQALNKAAERSPGPASDQARRLAAQLEMLAAGDSELRARAAAALVPGLKTLLQQTRDALQAQAITFETLPQDLVRDWVSSAGEFRVQAVPKGNSNNAAVLASFTRAVRSVAPNATGTPIIIEESGRTIVNAFVEAGVISFLCIVALLAASLRSARDVGLALAPLLLAGVLTLATCVVAGIALNYANVIALPLLFGIGVAFDIYFVVAWRSGARGVLASPLGRAVLLSAATTASAFGTLTLSSHPGTSSMGALLLISLGWILAAVLLFLPALLARFAASAGL